jgi:uncharacterized protein YjdB
MKKGLVIISLLFILFGCFGGDDNDNNSDQDLEQQAVAHYTEAVLNFQNEDLIQSVEEVEENVVRVVKEAEEKTSDSSLQEKIHTLLVMAYDYEVELLLEEGTASTKRVDRTLDEIIGLMEYYLGRLNEDKVEQKALKISVNMKKLRINPVDEELKKSTEQALRELIILGEEINSSNLLNEIKFGVNRYSVSKLLIDISKASTKAQNITIAVEAIDMMIEIIENDIVSEKSVLYEQRIQVADILVEIANQSPSDDVREKILERAGEVLIPVVKDLEEVADDNYVPANKEEERLQKLVFGGAYRIGELTEISGDLSLKLEAAGIDLVQAKISYNKLAEKFVEEAEEAEKYQEKIEDRIQLNLNIVDLALYEAYLLIGTGNISDGILALKDMLLMQEVLGNDAYILEVHFALAKAYKISGQLENAITEYKLIIELFSGFSLAEEAEKYLILLLNLEDEKEAKILDYSLSVDNTGINISVKYISDYSNIEGRILIKTVDTGEDITDEILTTSTLTKNGNTFSGEFEIADIAEKAGEYKLEIILYNEEIEVVHESVLIIKSSETTVSFYAVDVDLKTKEVNVLIRELLENYVVYINDKIQELETIDELKKVSYKLSGTELEAGEHNVIIVIKDGEEIVAEKLVTYTVNEVESLTLSVDNVVLKEGQTYQLTATTYPANIVEEIVWASEDNEIVEVMNQSGLIKAVSIGAVKISASLGDITEYVDVQVTASAIVDAKIAGDISEIIMTVSTELSLPESAMLYYESGMEKLAEINWNTENLDIDTVGEYTITGTVNGWTGTLTLLVKVEELAVASLEISPKVISIYVGETITYPSVSAIMTDGSKEEKTVNWDISAVDVDSVGEYTITGTIEGLELIPQFILEVIKSDEELVQEVYVDLDLGDTSQIISDLELPSEISGVSILWSTSNAAIVSTSGAITRPVKGELDATVNITASLSKGTVTMTKQFIIVVLAETKTDEELLSDAKEYLTVEVILGENISLNTITKDLNLITTTNSGVSISWTTSDAAIVSTSGSITRPAIGESDVTVNITASLSKGTVTMTKQFTIVVIANAKTDAMLVAEVETYLTAEVILGENISLNTITKDLNLITTTNSGVSISWTSTNILIVRANGTVIQPKYPNGDAVLTLTATITKGSVESEKRFELKVLAAPILLKLNPVYSGTKDPILGDDIYNFIFTEISSNVEKIKIVGNVAIKDNSSTNEIIVGTETEITVDVLVEETETEITIEMYNALDEKIEFYTIPLEK